MIEILIIPFHSALIAVAWVMFLTQPNALFDFWPKIAERISENEKWLHFAYNCEKCVAGQIAFWWTFFTGWWVQDAFFAALYAIFLAWGIGRIVNKVNKL